MVIRGSRLIWPRVSHGWLDTAAQLWLNLQTAVDVYDAEQELKAWEPDRLYRAG